MKLLRKEGFEKYVLTYFYMALLEIVFFKIVNYNPSGALEYMGFFLNSETPESEFYSYVVHIVYVL